ncbi:aldo/keto reductase [Pelagicoccus mobilis]|uniref:Aldo/keto reductase n=1 Tax=Pelagicoccus mobilis TaxID=415221 RepID=A0A934S4P9_9BACT|nr:aldo/keto reductase [Pelagicoccus mobilis]MBK1879732.1 aldo/keto reductase [Pelagicoccus mobilis]
MNTLNINTCTTLNDGIAMPMLGLGVFQITEADECVKAIHSAIDSGYRHIDTAVGYGNETEVGKAINETKIAREDLFITTKIYCSDFGTEKTRKCVETSLQNMDTDYIDLYLLHWPVRERTEEAFETLLELKAEGKVKSVGVSNFTVRRFEEQFFKSVDTRPSVNQVERHPYFANNELLEYCREKGIQVEAYSPLAQAGAIKDPTINEIADQYGKSPAQIMIRWQLQQGVVVIPKSVNPERIKQNADVFDFQLSNTDIQTMNALNKDESIITWRPEDDWF